MARRVNSKGSTKSRVVGRTTFVNTLCDRQILQGRDHDDPTTAHIEEGVRIKPITIGMPNQNKAEFTRLFNG